MRTQRIFKDAQPRNSVLTSGLQHPSRRQSCGDVIAVWGNASVHVRERLVQWPSGRALVKLLRDSGTENTVVSDWCVATPHSDETVTGGRATVAVARSTNPGVGGTTGRVSFVHLSSVTLAYTSEGCENRTYMYKLDTQ